jgi:hypothetical protein
MKLQTSKCAVSNLTKIWLESEMKGVGDRVLIEEEKSDDEYFYFIPVNYSFSFDIDL